MKTLPNCPICKKNDARVLLEGKFVCFSCYNKEMPKIKKLNEDRIITEAARILGERNAN